MGVRLGSSKQLRFSLRCAKNRKMLAKAWQELEARAEPDFFLSWFWIGCWLDQLQADAQRQAYVLAGEAGNDIVLLGIVVPATRHLPIPVPIHGLHLHETGDPGQDIITIEYNGFLTDRAWVGVAETAALKYLLSGVRISGHRHRELHVRSAAASFAERAAASGLAIRELQRKPSWRVDLAAVRSSGQSYLASLSANTRQQVRRSMRLYEKQGPLSAERAADEREALAFMGELKHLHQRYWTGRGNAGAFGYPAFEQFHFRLLQSCLPSKAVEIIRIAAGSEPIGYVYNFVYRGHVYAYQTGFRYGDDPRLKPGLVSHALCIELHLREGAIAYDFMAGDSRYKQNLGIPGPDMVDLLAIAPAWPLRMVIGLHQWVGERRRTSRMREGE